MANTTTYSGDYNACGDYSASMHACQPYINLIGLHFAFYRVEATNVANATIHSGDYNASMLVNIYTNLLDLRLAFCRAEATDVANAVLDGVDCNASMLVNFHNNWLDLHVAFCRAEATDVANAVLDGVDCIMLGAETLRGKHPVATVETILHICKQAEKVFDHNYHFETLMRVSPAPPLPLLSPTRQSSYTSPPCQSSYISCL